MVKTEKSILIVDPKVQRRDMLASRFRIHGYAVDLANSGFHALSLIENVDYKSVVIIGNPHEMAGIEIASLIRDMIPKSQLQIIMVSHKSHQEDVLEAYKLGVNEYLLYDDKIFRLLFDKIETYSPTEKISREFLSEEQFTEANETAEKIDAQRGKK
ncbi:response regulator [Halobacteriovorax sp. GB3]|uniref:response regulator n=1 Tax=Halobacteriovorax sp. GB3 TaxID=2719615 RepID=UPI00235EF38C|nr:response regulator [Halobacteriovorax sp. GB3]MDD0851525.1 response regulator [Halobacteriovorax sp. GB3]